jgi:hypothetical protein
VRDVHKAQDLTQGFFAHVVAKDSLRQAAPDRGRFRSFVLASLKNFMANVEADSIDKFRSTSTMEINTSAERPPSR